MDEAFHFGGTPGSPLAQLVVQPHERKRCSGTTTSFSESSLTD